MSNTMHTKSLLTLSVFTACISITAYGQNVQESRSSDIVVEAPRQLPVPAPRGTYSGAPIAVTSIKIPVFYTDLDLRNERDRRNLLIRVENVARDACRYLDRLYPLNPDPHCVDKATPAATAAARAAIKRAQARRRR